LCHDLKKKRNVASYFCKQFLVIPHNPNGTLYTKKGKEIANDQKVINILGVAKYKRELLFAMRMPLQGNLWHGMC